VPTVMVELVRPRPEPPVALPGPQIFFRVPKSPGAAALEDELGAAAFELGLSEFPEPPDRLQAAAPVRSRALAETAASTRRVECRARNFERTGRRAVRMRPPLVAVSVGAPSRRLSCGRDDPVTHVTATSAGHTRACSRRKERTWSDVSARRYRFAAFRDTIGARNLTGGQTRTDDWSDLS
jgi:hypothetical protein